MRLTALVCIAVAPFAASAVLCAHAAESQAPAAAVASTPAARPSPESIVEIAYLVTWEKDPRFRGRDPFQTVLHTVGGDTVTKRTAKFTLPRTPSEELAFSEKAASCLATADAALADGDFKMVQDNVETARQMVAVAMSSQVAKDRMFEVSGQLAALEQKFAGVRARASLAEALQIAARMQAYFESERYGDVLAADSQLQALNNESCLQNPQVAKTAADVLAACASVKNRAQIHIEFAKQALRVDAVSHFPEGRSFAIINGEVFGEGAQIAPEMTLAAVASGRVTFDFKGERIPQGLAQPEESPTLGTRGKEGRIR